MTIQKVKLSEATKRSGRTNWHQLKDSSEKLSASNEKIEQDEHKEKFYLGI
jgi:hypothetical protein